MAISSAAPPEFRNIPPRFPYPSLTTRLGLAATAGAFFFVVYGILNAYTASLSGVPSLYAGWEYRIPFVPWMILPYMSLDFLFVGAFLLCRSHRELRVLGQRVSLAILLSALGFWLMPLRFAFERPATTGLPGALFDLLSLDLPFNQCPSLHISLGLLIGAVYWRHTQGARRGLSMLWFALILASPLLVYQHHAVDILGGALVWLLCLLLVPGDLARHQRLALRYLGLTTSLADLAVGLGGAAWLLTLTLPGLLLMSLAYTFQRANWLAYPGHPVTRLLLFPVRLGLWLNWWLRSRRDPAAMVEILPGLWLGRRLNAREAMNLPALGIRTVLDLASELAPTPLPPDILRERMALLDLVSPRAETLQSAARFIGRQRNRGGVYVHCALGYGRAALAVARYLAGDGPLAPQLARLARQRKVVAPEQPGH